MKLEKFIFIFFIILLLLFSGRFIYDYTRKIPCYDFEINGVEKIILTNGGAKWNCGIPIMEIRDTINLCESLSNLVEIPTQKTRISVFKVEVEIHFNGNKNSQKSNFSMVCLLNKELVFDQGYRQFKNDKLSNRIVEILKITSTNSDPCNMKFENKIEEK